MVRLRGDIQNHNPAVLKCKTDGLRRRMFKSTLPFLVRALIDDVKAQQNFSPIERVSKRETRGAVVRHQTEMIPDSLELTLPRWSALFWVMSRSICPFQDPTNSTLFPHRKI